MENGDWPVAGGGRAEAGEWNAEPRARGLAVCVPARGERADGSPRVLGTGRPDTTRSAHAALGLAR